MRVADGGSNLYKEILLPCRRTRCTAAESVGTIRYGTDAGRWPECLWYPRLRTIDFLPRKVASIFAFQQMETSSMSRGVEEGLRLAG